VSAVHSTLDWDETTCDLSLWDELPKGDVVIDEIFDPATKAPTHAPCSKCYPPEHAAQRAAVWAQWGNRIRR
jgi:hypothetical protein